MKRTESTSSAQILNHLCRPVGNTRGLIRRCSQALAERDKLLFDLTLSSQLLISTHTMLAIPRGLHPSRVTVFDPSHQTE
jgi:hypothetical protein